MHFSQQKLSLQREPLTSGRIRRRISRRSVVTQRMALNEFGRIFDKKKIEEQQELAAVFGEEAFRLAHNMNLEGQVLFSLYRSWFISTSCWNVYGNGDNGILFREGSLVGYDYFPGFYGMDIFRKERVRLFDTGIYDIRTGNMIPLYWKR